MYDNGRGVPWTTRRPEVVPLAAEQGDAAAQFNLGVMYASGVGVPLDYQEAVRWYRLAAEQGYAGAQHNLGLKYEYGDGVPQDYQEAVRWYGLAAEQGNGSYSQFSQYRLSVMYNKLGDKYATGEGVPEDDAEAAKWYRKAAEQGDAAAQIQSRGHVCQRTGRPPGLPGGRGVVSQGRRAGGRFRPNLTSVTCTPKARACRRTMPRP